MAAWRISIPHKMKRRVHQIHCNLIHPLFQFIRHTFLRQYRRQGACGASTIMMPKSWHSFSLCFIVRRLWTHAFTIWTDHISGIVCITGGLWTNLCLFLKTESRYRKIATTESCFHLHKILVSVLCLKITLVVIFWTEKEVLFLLLFKILLYHTVWIDNYHIKKIFADSEWLEDSVVRNFRITVPKETT